MCSFVGFFFFFLLSHFVLFVRVIVKENEVVDVIYNFWFDIIKMLLTMLAQQHTEKKEENLLFFLFNQSRVVGVRVCFHRNDSSTDELFSCAFIIHPLHESIEYVHLSCLRVLNVFLCKSLNIHRFFFIRAQSLEDVSYLLRVQNNE